MIRPTLAYGSYIRNDMAGLGALGDDASLSLADQVMLQILSAQGISSQTVTEWAEQTGDIAWQPVTALVNYQLFPITDAHIVAVATAATAVPSQLAVVAPFLSFGTAVASAFNGTPYAYSYTEAVYSQQDSAAPPRIYFLYWLTLRPATDPQRGNTSLNLAATGVGGVLSYVHETPLTGADRAPPSMAFSQALALQSGSVATPTPILTPGSVTTIPIPTDPDLSLPNPAAKTAAQASASASNGKAVMIVAAGAALAFVGYHFFASRKAS